MPEIIKHNGVVNDDWLVWRDSEILPERGRVIVSLALWQTHREQLKTLGEIGVYLCNESPKALAASIDELALIAIDFPTFSDGRGFSYARELREQLGYQAELRAIGGFIRDQLFYLSRCGFDAFALEGDDLQEALQSLNDFSECYQPSADQQLPLFRRHQLQHAAAVKLAACA